MLPLPTEAMVKSIPVFSGMAAWMLPLPVSMVSAPVSAREPARILPLPLVRLPVPARDCISILPLPVETVYSFAVICPPDTGPDTLVSFRGPDISSRPRLRFPLMFSILH